MFFVLFSFLNVTVSGFGCAEYETFDSLSEYDGASILSERINMTASAINDGAVCLDGSVPAFYWRRGQNEGRTKFLIYFDGGGWCGGYNENERVSPCQDSCVHRAFDKFGSSKGYKLWMDNDKGIMSSNKQVNPLAYNWNTVLVKYCDGSSYNSDNEEVKVINASLSLHFRGFRILNAVFETLQSDEFGLMNASDVVIGGCSAGGLNIYMHSNYIFESFINPNAHFMALIDSGFFLQYEGTGKYISAMKWLWDNMNMTKGLNADCLSHFVDDPFQCMFAQNLSPFINVPTFNMQSRYDEWQKICELQSTQAQNVNDYGQNLTHYYQKMYQDANGTNATAEKHAVFMDSCSRHCQNGNFYSMNIDGYNQSSAIYDFYYGQTNKRVWFQNDTYPCEQCCP